MTLGIILMPGGLGGGELLWGLWGYYKQRDEYKFVFFILNLLQPEEFAQQLENFEMEILPSGSQVVKIDTESLKN